MVDVKAKSVLNYVVEIIAGLAIILGVLMAVSGLVRADLFAIIFGVVLIAGGAWVLKRPGRARWPR